MDETVAEETPGKMRCSVCTEVVEEPGVSLDDCVDRSPTVTSCGHLFHKNCLIQWFSVTQVDEDNLALPKTCPSCRSTTKPEDILRYRGCSDRFLAEVRVKSEELQAVAKTTQLLTTETDLQFQRRQHSFLFVQPGVVREDAACYNCESTVHLTRSCPHDVVIRHTVTVGPRRYPAITFCRSARAGNLVTDFEDRLRLGRTLSRPECKFLFCIYHFGSACRSCGEPDCDGSNELCRSSRKKNLCELATMTATLISREPHWHSNGKA